LYFIPINNKNKTFYPDIAVVRKGLITSFCDLKMDLGWKRDSLSLFCRDKKLFINKIKGKQCNLKDGITKEVRTYIIDKDVNFNIVLISGGNISKSVLDKHQFNIKGLGHDVELFILTRGKHPNEYGYSRRKLSKLIKIDNDAFKKLIKKLSR